MAQVKQRTAPRPQFVSQMCGALALNHALNKRHQLCAAAMGALKDAACEGVKNAPTTAMVLEHRLAFTAMYGALHNVRVTRWAPKTMRVQDFDQLVVALLLIEQVLNWKHHHG